MGKSPKIENTIPKRTVTRTVKVANSRYLTSCDVPTGGVRYDLKAAGYELVERLSTNGRDLASIAKALGIDRDTFRVIRKRDAAAQEAVERGRAALGDELHDILLEHARGGITVAAIFLAKARCGWREGEAMPGATVTNNTQINIHIPARMSDHQFQQIVDGTHREQ